MSEEKMVCPRCHRRALNPNPVYNALSREMPGQMVCDACGTEEALIAYLKAGGSITPRKSN